MGGDYRQHEREAECVTVGSLPGSCVREGGAEAEEEAQDSECYKSRDEVHSDARREVGGVHSVRWAAHRSGGFKSLWRSDEERHIQKRG